MISDTQTQIQPALPSANTNTLSHPRPFFSLPLQSAGFYSALCFVLILGNPSYAKEAFKLSHGPMLGAVAENSTAIWIRTTSPGKVSIQLDKIPPSNKPQTQHIETSKSSDNTGIIRFDQLIANTPYRYSVMAGDAKEEGTFTTLGSALNDQTIRIVYGYGYQSRENKVAPGKSVFTHMASRKPNLTIFLGDFPYTGQGQKGQIRKGTRALRGITGFKQLTSSIPTYGIYDDHDFGPNDCDGTHKNADEALATFKEFWPNPSYGLPNDKGIYCSFVVGPVEFFLLDGRYPARIKEKTMLGKIQFDWLCSGLKNSKSRYKVLVSGTQFARVKKDSWAGKPYIGERKKLFDFIFNNQISGVLGISGDIHRSDIFKLPLGGTRTFHDFTPGALSRIHRVPPKKRSRPKSMIHSYGKKDDNNMYGEILFHPATDNTTALIYRSISVKNGVVHEHTLAPADLGITDDSK